MRVVATRGGRAGRGGGRAAGGGARHVEDENKGSLGKKKKKKNQKGNALPLGRAEHDHQHVGSPYL